jgi:hypothetical protein
MGKIVYLGSAGPDDPIYREGITIFTPYRPSPEIDPQIGGEWELYESDELDMEGNSWIEVLSRPDLDLWRLAFEYNPLWSSVPCPPDPEGNWLEHTTVGLIDYFLWSEVEECEKAPGPRLAAFYELALGNGWFEICKQIRVAVNETNE